MALYSGVLKTLSAGNLVEHRTRRYYQITNVEVEKVTGRYMQRAFIDVGDHHLVNVRLTEYMDEVLASSIGQQVTLNCHGARAGSNRPKSVFSMRTDRGRVKPGFFPVVFNAVANVVKLVLGGLIVGVFLAFIGWFVVVNLLIALDVIAPVPEISDAAPVRDQLSVLYHYVPFVTVLLGAAAVAFYRGLYMPIRGVLGTFRVWVAF